MRMSSPLWMSLTLSLACLLVLGEVESSKLPGWYGSWKKRDAAGPTSSRERRVDALMKDPAFLQCIESNTGGDMSKAYSVMASCYSFVGRPRFGKRGLVGYPGMGGVMYGPSASHDAFERNNYKQTEDQRLMQELGLKPVWDFSDYNRK